MLRPHRPSYAHSRPAPRRAPGPPASLSDTVIWTRIVNPPERYRIVYRGRDGDVSERTVSLNKVGHSGDTDYFGVTHAGRFKTLRADGVITVIEQLTTGHEQSIRPAPSYSLQLPAFPLTNAVYKIPTIALSNRTWTVDLNRYTCTCPEKRIRLGMGYEPGQLGHVCPHMARAILDNLPKDTPGWSPELQKFLSQPKRIHIQNLT